MEVSSNYADLELAHGAWKTVTAYIYFEEIEKVLNSVVFFRRKNYYYNNIRIR